MTTSKILIPVPIKEIYPHPDNPRKDLGDITELTESIKKNGIMQNLSVIPGHYENGEWIEQVGYTLIIGHRRCEAARRAGITEVPCRIIKDMTINEQISTMLEENMQRNDLTIIEQAQGFQMMLDLGDTVDTIADKTGFSKQTVKHRVNLAKLDLNLLKEKQEDEEYQLNLKDLYELEKIKDIDVRNRILEDASDSNDIAWEVEKALKEERVKENESKIKDLLAKAEITEAPANVKNELYSQKWKRHITISLEEPMAADLDLTQYKGLMYVRMQWREEITIVEEQEVPKKEPSKWEIEQQKRDEDKKILRNITTGLLKHIEEFKKLIIKGGIEIQESVANYQILAETLMDTGMCIEYEIVELITGKGLYETNQDETLKKQYKDTITSLSPIKRTCLYIKVNADPFTWDNLYHPDNARKLKAMAVYFATYGYSITEDELKLIDGTHEAYKKES